MRYKHLPTSIWTVERRARLEELFPRYGSMQWRVLNDEFPDLRPVTQKQVSEKANRLGLNYNGPEREPEMSGIRKRSMRFALAGRDAGLTLQEVRFR